MSTISVLTGADCSSLLAVCPSTDCCGTARPKAGVVGNSATTNKEVCLAVSNNNNDWTDVANGGGVYVFTCNSYQDLGAHALHATVAVALGMTTYMLA